MKEIIYKADALAALDAIEPWNWTDSEYEVGELSQWQKDREAVEALPPVQPEKRTDKRTETHASDLISRQAAIEKFEPWLRVEGYSEGELNMLKAVLYELRFLPSAQPITEEDYIELHDRYGAEVESVVRDMVSGEGKRWMI